MEHSRQAGCGPGLRSDGRSTSGGRALDPAPHPGVLGGALPAGVLQDQLPRVMGGWREEGGGELLGSGLSGTGSKWPVGS